MYRDVRYSLFSFIILLLIIIDYFTEIAVLTKVYFYGITHYPHQSSYYYIQVYPIYVERESVLNDCVTYPKSLIAYFRINRYPTVYIKVCKLSPEKSHWNTYQCHEGAPLRQLAMRIMWEGRVTKFRCLVGTLCLRVALFYAHRCAGTNPFPLSRCVVTARLNIKPLMWSVCILLLL